jgi:hypothetical protein
VTVSTLQQLVEEIEELKGTAAARRERDRRLDEAWKKPPRQQSALAFLIQSDVPIKDVAVALRRECESRRAGKPGGLRWRLPHYLVAYLVERWRSRLRLSDDGMAMAAMTEICLPPSGVEWSTDELITYWIKYTNGWAFMRGKTPLDPEIGGRDHERVKTLLRGSKRRRLVATATRKRS